MPERHFGLEGLPVELIYEIQLGALSENLPCTSQRLRNVFSSTSNSYRAEYLNGRLIKVGDLQVKFTRALCYPICTQDVLRIFCQHYRQCGFVRCELPKRLFRSLAPRTGLSPWKYQDPPLPFLRFLFDAPEPVCRPCVDSHGGYALTKAVHARHTPLIQFLLHHGASPGWKNGLAVTVAIRQKDLPLVKMLIERDNSPYQDDNVAKKKGKGKRRRLTDRIEVHRDMLKVAVKCDARDIVKYFTEEKGCIPDMQTLHMMSLR